MIRIFILIFFAVLSQSCRETPGAYTSKPEWVLDEDTMVSIIVDLRIADAAMYSGHNGKQRDKVKDWSFIMQKHQIHDSIFRKSHDYYAGQPEIAEKIYEKAIDRLSEMVAKNAVGQ